MNREDAEHWRTANAVFNDLMDLAPSERQQRIAALELESAVAEKLDRLIQADESPSDSIDPDPGWILRADVGVDEADTLSGRRVGDWILEDQVGEGGMSTVYRCRRDTDDYQQIGALKLLRMGLLTASGKLRFDQEKQILADLRHPHIAGLLDAGTTDDGTPFLVLEYVDGQPIDQHVAGLPHRRVVELFSTVCKAVAFAQQNLIVHRDLKPSNILVDSTGEPRLLDFGIARLVADQEDTATTTRAYTPGYAAPEQLAGQPVTTATDVFGLGATLYRLLTGDTATERSSGLRTGAVRFPGSVNKDLQNVVRMALRSDPRRRYRDAAALQEDLSNWLASRPVAATGDSLLYSLTKFANRHRFGVTASLLLILTGAVGIAATVWQAGIAKQQAQVAMEQSDQATAVQSFLVSLFRASAAGRESQDELPTTEELLERGVQQAQTDYEDQPALKAEMLKILGQIYVTHARYTDATALLRQSLELYRALPTRRDIGEAVILISLARAVHRETRGDQSEAIEFASRAYELLDPAEKVGLRDDAADVLVSALKWDGREDEALAIAQQNYREVRQFSDNSFVRVHATHTLAQILVDTNGSLQQGLALFEEAWELARDVESRMELKHAVAAGYAGALDSANQHDRAIDMAREALAISRATYRPGHARIGRSLGNLASYLSVVGEFEEAAEAFQESLEILKQSLGPDHVSVAAAYNNLGGLLRDSQKPNEAISAFRESSRIVAIHLPEGDWRRMVLQLNLADTLLDAGQYPEARRLLNQATESISRERTRASYYSVKAKLHMASNEWESAREFAEKAVTLGRQINPDASSTAAKNLARLALIELELENPDAADQWFSECQAEIQALQGNFDTPARDAIRFRTQFLVATNRSAEAARLIAEDVESLRNTMGEHHPMAVVLQQWIEDTALNTSP